MMKSIYLGYVYVMLNVAFLILFSSTPVFCLSCPCHVDESCTIISPSSFFAFLFFLFPTLAAILLIILSTCCHFYRLHVQPTSTLTVYLNNRKSHKVNPEKKNMYIYCYAKTNTTEYDLTVWDPTPSPTAKKKKKKKKRKGKGKGKQL